MVESNASSTSPITALRGSGGAWATGSRERRTRGAGIGPGIVTNHEQKEGGCSVMRATAKSWLQRDASNRESEYASSRAPHSHIVATDDVQAKDNTFHADVGGIHSLVALVQNDVCLVVKPFEGTLLPPKAGGKGGRAVCDATVMHSSGMRRSAQCRKEHGGWGPRLKNVAKRGVGRRDARCAVDTSRSQDSCQYQCGHRRRRQWRGRSNTHHNQAAILRHHRDGLVEHGVHGLGRHKSPTDTGDRRGRSRRQPHTLASGSARTSPSPERKDGREALSREAAVG